jgi:PBP1b-binding outer membrane lipoprotein LpoB
MRKTIHRLSLPLAAASLLALGLSGCSRSEPEPAPTENYVDEPVAEPTPEPTETVANIAEPDTNMAEAEPAPPPPPERSVDQQMLDDASATGMTARAKRGDDAAPPLPDAANQSEAE